MIHNQQGDLKKSFPRWTRESRIQGTVFFGVMLEVMCVSAWLLPFLLRGRNIPVERAVITSAGAPIAALFLHWISGLQKITVSDKGIKIGDSGLVRWQSIESIEEGLSRRKPPRKMFTINFRRRNIPCKHEIITYPEVMDEIMALMEHFIPEKVRRSSPAASGE